MPKEKKIDEKKDLENKSKIVKKSSYSKKKKIKKIITNGIAYVQSTFNNGLDVSRAFGCRIPAVLLCRKAELQRR